MNRFPGGVTFPLPPDNVTSRSDTSSVHRDVPPPVARPPASGAGQLRRDDE